MVKSIYLSQLYLMNQLGYPHFNDFCKHIICFIAMVVYVH
jgi:hypothetical protein